MMWQDIKRFDSSDSNVSKFVFTQESAVAEAVLYKYGSYRERTVICCSTQSGCPMGCTFCGTGKQFVRNLTAEEIIAQVSKCMEHIEYSEGTHHSDIKKFQIMFMSMGEPMLNFRNLEKSIRALNKAYPDAALLISTSGPSTPDAFWDLFQLSQEIDKIGLQFSVHESTDEARDNLIPFKKKMNLATISFVGNTFFMETGRKPFFNYCVHENNNTKEDVQNLLKYFNPLVWEATISVICEADETVQASLSRQEELANNFAELLLKEGYNTRVFNPAGQDDVGGGCGQLWFTQEWMKSNPNKSRVVI